MLKRNNNKKQKITYKTHQKSRRHVTQYGGNLNEYQNKQILSRLNQIKEPLSLSDERIRDIMTKVNDSAWALNRNNAKGFDILLERLEEIIINEHVTKEEKIKFLNRVISIIEIHNNHIEPETGSDSDSE
jgi:hypothetical protein